MLLLLLSEPQVGSTLKLALARVLKTLNTALLEADYVSTLERRVFDFVVGVARSFRHVGGSVELAAEGTLVDFELENLLIRVYKILIFVLVF